MRNIDSSAWMDNPVLQVVETAKDSPTGGSSFTLFTDTVGVNLEEGGDINGEEGCCKMNFLERIENARSARSRPVAARRFAVSSSP